MRLFLDSSTVISIIVERNEKARSIWALVDADLFIDDYVVKEIRRILRTGFGRSDYEIEIALEMIDRRCTILPDPSRNLCGKIRITDKSDRPIVCSAMQHDCVLVTEDRLLQKEAGRYVRSMLPKDVPPE